MQKPAVFAFKPIGEANRPLLVRATRARQGTRAKQATRQRVVGVQRPTIPKEPCQTSLLIHGDCGGLGAFLNTLYSVRLLKDHSDNST